MRVFRYILLLVLLSVLGVSCSVKEFDGVSAVPDGVAQIELGLRIPVPIVTRAMSEYGVVENETTGFVVFAFNQTASSLVWMLKSGDTNYESSLSNYSGTTAIKWRSGVFPAGYDSGDSAYGTLYIEAPVDSEALELLVLANVDLSSASANVTDGVIDSYNLGDTVLIPSSSSLEDVEAALSALDYSASALTGTYGPATDVWDLTTGEMVTDEVGTETNNCIPMAGRATLSSGVQVGATGAVSLRRSLAKVSVEIECSEASLVKFWPKELKIMNVSDYAAPYAPDGENGEQVTLIPSPVDGELYTALTFFEDLPSSVSSMDEALSVSAQIYVPETLTWKSEGDKDTHLCVLVGGIFDSGGIYGSDGAINDYDNWMETNPAWSSPLVWYRLDFIPSDANSSEEELTEILRNHHYKFTVSNLAYLGSYSETAALAMEYPDNYVISSIGEGSWTLFVEDEDINSVTVAFESSSDDGADVGANDYVGVSGVDLTIELPSEASAFTGSEATHLKMVTNYAEWTAGSGIDLGNCDGVFSFSFTEDDDVNENVYWYNQDTGEKEYPAHSGYLWIWADGQSGSMESASAADARASASASLYSNGTLNVGKSYTFYICVGVVRKEIHVILAEE